MVKRIHFVSAGAIGLLLFLNVTQALRIRYLETQARLGDSVNLSNIGSAMSSFRAKDLSGRPATVNLKGSGRPTLLYVFSPSCIWCLRNETAFESLFRQARSNYTVIGLSLDNENLARFASSHGMAMPIYSDLDPGFVQRYRLGATPETLVVSPGGHIVQDWLGAYLGNTADAMRQFFRIRLPELSRAGPGGPEPGQHRKGATLPRSD